MPWGERTTAGALACESEIVVVRPEDIAVLTVSYLLGSIPWAYLVTRLAIGQHIRTIGSGNVGTRNAFRVAGRLGGQVTLVLDVTKGAGAYWAASLWASGDVLLHAARLAAMVGHWFPIWLGGRGGIGQAVVTGFIFARWPILALITVPLFLLRRLAVPQFNLDHAVAALAGLAIIPWRGGSAWDVTYPLILLGCASANKLNRWPPAALTPRFGSRRE